MNDKFFTENFNNEDIEKRIVTDENRKILIDGMYARLRKRMFEEWKAAYVKSFNEYEEVASELDDLFGPNAVSNSKEHKEFTELLKAKHQLSLKMKLLDELIDQEDRKIKEIDETINDNIAFLISESACYVLKDLRTLMNAKFDKLGAGKLMAAQYIAEFKKASGDSTHEYIDSVAPVLTQFVEFFLENGGIYDELDKLKSQK